MKPGLGRETPVYICVAEALWLGWWVGIGRSAERAECERSAGNREGQSAATGRYAINTL